MNPITRARDIIQLHPNHPEILRLKEKHTPTEHGYKVWDASWLLIDYLNHMDNLHGKRIMDLGCGWGLAGIYCAKRFGASVTCVDIDDAVYPYLTLMAETNQVNVDFLHLDMDRVGSDILKNIDVIIGSDICFDHELIDPFRALFKRAESSSVEQVILCDPGRWPFDDLIEYYKGNEKAQVIEWATRTPSNFAGKILRFQF